MSIVYWGGTEQTPASLAERTLVAENDVRKALQYVEDRKLLQVERRAADNLQLSVLERHE